MKARPKSNRMANGVTASVGTTMMTARRIPSRLASANISALCDKSFSRARRGRIIEPNAFSTGLTTCAPGDRHSVKSELPRG